MNGRLRKTLSILLGGITLLMACNSLRVESSTDGEPGGGNRGEIGESSGFGAIIFSEQVTDDGVIIGAANTFPPGTQLVWAYFDYWGMDTGKSWGRLWTFDGEVYIDGQAESWEDLEVGWVAYSIGGAYTLEPGVYELTLYIGGRPVKRSSFQILENGVD